MRTLDCLLPGESAYIRAISNEGSIGRRLRDLGLVENTFVTCVGCSPMGDPKAFRIRGAVIALRKAELQEILV